ncbi:ATP-binding cassette domain-containing protein [Fischerella sp. PCC 9605]|uniref:ATP-binding cassette domain-containing protein n=1 Tax=Fischerella sp. PCC 9605 TaxID=1173024 RepID=UPI0004AFBCFD|nr:ATP-binding cassette domain-containing protein [Fischerella sp. PCC 9605]
MKALEAYNLKKIYRQNHQNFPAVQNVSLTIAPGELLAFLGPNGAGKTTTIKMIAGLIQPDAGSVRIAGSDPHRNPAALQKLGAVLEGNRNLYWRLSPEENLEYFGVLFLTDSTTSTPVRNSTFRKIWVNAQTPYPSAATFTGNAAEVSICSGISSSTPAFIIR